MSDAAPARSQHPSPSANAPTVLVVDDEPAVRALVAAALGAAGWRVLEAIDGTSALELARRRRPDLILLDLALPGLSGLEVCRRLSREPATSRIPVLFLTGFAERVDRQALGQTGALGVLEKPFSLATLTKRAAEAVGRPL